MDALAQRLQRDDARAVLVGYSGGLDSSVLLHACATSPLRAAGLRAIHVHHGLHADADAWEAHCQRQCDALDVPLEIVRVQVAHVGEGLEAAARHARHAAFEQVLRDDEILALAHHRDDQAETFLLRALRASGPDGMAAMRPWRAFGGSWLWRPLLDLPRAELRAYADTHGLAWIEDPSNVDTTPDRNYLRHVVMPLLRQRWPQADAAFARSARLQAEAVDLLDAGDMQVLAAVATPDPASLDVTALHALPGSRRARVLRYWVDACGLPPLPGNGIDAIERDLLHAPPDAQTCFAWADARVTRWRGLLHAQRTRASLCAGWETSWDGRAPLQLPTGDTLALTGAAGGFAQALRVHARVGGERITMPGRSHSHALKHVLQDLGVPPWLRERLPLLSDGEGVLLAAGDRVQSNGFNTWLAAHGARLVWTH